MTPDFKLDAGATAWVLASTALVLLMTPGLAFFYGGMVRVKHVLGMLMQNFTTMAVVSVMWVLVAYSLAFDRGNGFIGGLHFAGLQAMTEPVPGFEGDAAQVIPPVVSVGFQLMFAVITPALITGATADRWRYASFVPFIVLWSLLVYAPVAHWGFSPVGWAARLGTLDFAGGTVVHTNAGAGALAMALLLGRRRGWPEARMRPHSLPLVMLGTGLLWFGWFGFNSGSALRADGLAGVALVNTNTAAAMALLAWITLERIRYGKATSLGAASGVVAGLVAITPCAGFVSPLGALAVGAIAGSVCALAVGIKSWFGIDDSLDVVAVHLVGGIVGSLCVGLFASRVVNPAGADGLFYGGGYRQLGYQCAAVVAVTVYSLVVTGAIGLFLNRLVGNRVRPREEAAGLDLSQHGETAYESGVQPEAVRAWSSTPGSPDGDPARADRHNEGVR
jgi:ammonium transporter, Amt family